MEHILKKTIILSSFLVCLVGCNGTSNDSNYHYTLNTAISLSPKAWNVHNWETSDENFIPSYTGMGFYAVVLNDTKDGYKIVNEMASNAPIDVGSKITKEEKNLYGYVGQVGSNYVYDIELNPLACFENNEPIKAQDYVDSMERLLSPKMTNFRADTMYASNLVVANAEEYFKQGKITTEPLFDYIKTSEDGYPSDSSLLTDNVYILNLGASGGYFNTIFPTQSSQGSFYSCLANRTRASTDQAELAAKRIIDATQYYIFNYTDFSNKSGWENVEKYSDINDDDKLNLDIDIYNFDSNKVIVRKSLNQTMDENDESTFETYSSKKLIEDLQMFVSSLGNNVGVMSKDWAWKLPLFAHKENNQECSFDKVGIKAIDDYTIRLYLKRKITMFDLQFSLTSNWLVYVPLYDELTKPIPGSNMYATQYGTSNVNNYVSYGPYRLETFVRDSSIVMVKNENWYGYNDGKHDGLYQCDRIVAKIIANHATQKMMFLKGELDSIELQKSDISDYGKSSRVRFVPESYTQKISFNSDRTRLKARQDQTSRTDDNKTLLSNLKFRQALSLSIDRKEFASNATAGSQAFTGLLNSLYLIDSKEGISYRSTEQGKSVYNKVYSKLGGEEGGEILNLEEVKNGYTDNRSGYNLKYAQKLVQEALEEEKNKEDGYRDGQILVIEFLVSQTPSESETVRDAINYLTTAFNKACNPSNLKVEINAKKDEDYYNTASNGNFDMIYSIWGGAVNNPYGLMQVYADAHFAKNCEYGFKGKQDQISLEIEFSDGSKATKTFYAWFDDIIKNLVEPTKNEGETWTEEQIENYNRIHTKRLDVLAGLEAGVLSRFEAIPLVARSNANINSFKVENGTDTYVTFVGYGGIRESTFNYTDEQWNSFLRAHNNNLTEEYKL